MAIVKSKKKTNLTSKVDFEVISELKEYAKWAEVDIDDVVEQALEYLFSSDSDWVNEKNKNASSKSVKKTHLVREIYAEIASGNHPEFSERPGFVKSGTVSKAIIDKYGQGVVAHGTITAQTSLCNKLIRNEANERERDEDAGCWAFLCDQIPALRENQG